VLHKTASYINGNKTFVCCNGLWLLQISCHRLIILAPPALNATKNMTKLWPKKNTNQQRFCGQVCIQRRLQHKQYNLTNISFKLFHSSENDKPVTWYNIVPVFVCVFIFTPVCTSEYDIIANGWITLYTYIQIQQMSTDYACTMD